MIDLAAVLARAERAANPDGHELAPLNYRAMKESQADVPALAAELRELRKDNARLREAHDLHEANHLRIVERAQAELRAAREVVKAARGGSHPDLDEDEAAAQLADALDAYDRVVFR